MKVLFLTPRYPYEILGGGLLKTARMIDFLAHKYEMSVFCLSTEIEEVMIDGGVTTAPLSRVNYKGSLCNLLKSYINKVPLSIQRNYSFKLKEYIDKEIEKFDLIFIDHFIMFQYVPLDCHKKIIFHAHNAEFMLWERSVYREKNLARKILRKIESIRVRFYEKSICNKADFVLAAPNDLEAFKKSGIDESKCRLTYHLGDDSSLKYSAIDFYKQKNNVIFLGNINWEPNYDGIVWFIRNCWKNIKEKVPLAKLHIIGDGADRLGEFTKIDDSIIAHGFLKDLEVVLGTAKVFISPLLFGSGMKVKNITALYRGIPIVTTDIGNEGIDLVHGIDAIISNDSLNFSKSVSNLLLNPELCNSLANNARVLSERKFSWESNLKKLVDVINEAS